MTFPDRNSLVRGLVFPRVLGVSIQQEASLRGLHVVLVALGQGHDGVVHLQCPRVHDVFDRQALPVQLGLLKANIKNNNYNNDQRAESFDDYIMSEAQSAVHETLH